MIFSICLYGHSILREKTLELPLNYPHLNILLNNLFETMYNAQGVGIAAPQIGLRLRIFVIDLTMYENRKSRYTGLKKVFINPVIIERSKENVIMTEGCLSIPNINEEVDRPGKICIQYLNENRKFIEEEYCEGVLARVIQHEYDHLDGVLFTDHVKGSRKQIIAPSLNKMMDREAKRYLI